MAYTELLNAPAVSADRDGQYAATRTFRVYNTTDQNALAALIAGGEGLLLKVSEHPRFPFMLLDSYSTTPSGPDTIVTLRYNNRNATGGDLDPLDESFGGTWTMGFRTIKLAVPTIVVEESVLSLSDETTVSTQFWNLGEPLEVEQTQPVFTWQSSDDGLSDGSVTLSLQAAANVWKQAGRLHTLPFGGRWKFEPRQVRQAVKGKFLVDYSWVLETDVIRPEAGAFLPYTHGNPYGTGAQWWLPNGAGSNYAIPSFPNPDTEEPPLLRPAYANITVTPYREFPPDYGNPPILGSVVSRVDDPDGWKLLPGINV